MGAGTFKYEEMQSAPASNTSCMSMLSCGTSTGFVHEQANKYYLHRIEEEETIQIVKEKYDFNDESDSGETSSVTSYSSSDMDASSVESYYYY